MNRTKMTMRQRAKTAKIPEIAALDLLNDLDHAIARGEIESIRMFSRECELSGMDQEAARGREIARVLEQSKSKTRTKVSLADVIGVARARPSERTKAGDVSRRRDTPSIAEMIAAETAERMASAGPFDRDSSEETERRRVEEQNKQLAETQRRLEAARRRQVGQAEPEPWWRR